MMKKVFVSIFVLIILLMGFSVFAKTAPPKIQINGVTVVSDSNYLKGQTIKVDVEAYFNILNQSYAIDNKKKRIKTHEKYVSISYYKGKIVADLNELAKASKAEKVTYFKKDNLYYVFDLPEGVIQLTPVVPKMGAHWARPRDLPLGPIYGEYKGKLVFIEQMPSQEFFTKGQSKVNLDGMRGYPSPSINHTNIEFQPHGHEGYEVPHFDIHHYFISPKEQDSIQ